MAERNLRDRDREVIWHPYTQMKDALPHIPIVRGEGAVLIGDDGKRYIDAVSSWWVTIHGHAHPYIAEKVSAQLLELEHAIFAGFTHRPAIELAERLLDILPGNQRKIFYSDNGSTAVEVALKMCLQYWSNTGQPRNKILALHHSYHGDTFGAMSVSARSSFTASFDPFLFDVTFIDAPTVENLPRLVDFLREIHSDVAAFIFEPLIQGAGGMRMYEAACLEQLLKTCKELNILTIADEVMTGFGRTGKWMAMDHIRFSPDLVTLSKGLTGGTMALGVTSCSQSIYDAFLSDDKHKTLFHGHSFTANPIACSSALASLDLLLQPTTRDNIDRICRRHEQFAATISDHQRVREVRTLGTIVAVEWETGEDTSYFHGLRDRLYSYFIHNGILLRPLGNVIYILPPYCITDEQLDQVYGKIREALDKF